MAWLIAVALVVLGLAVRTRPLVVLAASPVLAPFSEQWSFGGVLVDSTDLVLAALAGMVVLRPVMFRSQMAVPGMGIWLALGVLASLAYVTAEQHQEYITDPVRLAYQLYRYCWKPLLFYPLAAALLRERADFALVLGAAVLGAVLASVEAISQGYAGLRATGPFGYGANAMGGVLVLPLMACLFGLVEPPSPRMRWLYGVATLVIVRALLFSGSRGAMAGVFAGGVVLVSGLRATSAGRKRLRQLGVSTLLILLAITLVRGHPLERPTVQRFVKGDAQEDDYGGTLEWRLNERWPHFFEQVRQHPWLGVGTDIDLELGAQANTPHNGYLSLAVTNGVPFLALYVMLCLSAVRASRHAVRRAAEAWHRPIAVTVQAALVGVLVHNLVDSIFTLPPVSQMFWMFAAVGARLGQTAREAPDAVGSRSASVVLRMPTISVGSGSTR